MRVKNIPIVLLVLVLTATAVGLGQIILAYRDYPFFFDEAIHANGGLALTVDLWNRDLGNFLRTFYQQGFYPPAFSIPKGLAFYLFGASTAVARGFSLVCLILAQPVIFFFAQNVRRDFADQRGQGHLDPQAGGWVGLIAILLTLTSLPLLNASTHTMMEAPGLLISFVFLWLYYRTFASSAIDGTLARPANSDKRGFVLTGLVLMGVFLTKYTYGLAMIGTVGVMELSMLDWRSGVQLRRMGGSWAVSLFAPMRPAVNRWLWLVGPFVVCLIIWLGTPYKLGEFFGYATAQPNEAQWTWDALLFYPRNILRQQLPSPLFGAISLLGLVWGVQHRGRPEVRLLLIYFVIGMLEMLVNFPKIPRFVVTFLPAMHILTGLMLVDWLGGRKRLDIERWSFVALIGASLIWAVPVLYGRYSTINLLMSSQLKTAPAVNEIPPWIDEQIPDGSRFYIVNYFELINAQSLAWAHIVESRPLGRRFEQYEMDGALLAEATPENIERFRQDVLRSGAEFVLVIEGGDWGSGWPAYDRELGDFVEYHAHQEFQVEVVDRPEELLWLTMPDRSLAEHVLEHERGVFNLKLLIYRVN